MATTESYETSSGKRYQVRYRTPERTQTKKRGFKTKRDAEQFAASVEVQKYRGEYVSHQAGQATIGELGPGWLVRQSAHLKPSSLLALEIGWRVHVEPRWRDVRVSDISRTIIQDWVAALGADRSATTVKRAYGVLSSILDDAVNDRRIIANPAKGVKTKRKVMRGRVYLNHRQVEHLAQEAGDSSGIVLVLAYTGIRWGEMIALRVRDVDTSRRRLSIEHNAVEVGTEIHIGTPKNHERRSVPYIQMLDPLFEKACAGKPPEALLFPGPDGELRRRTRTDGSSGGWFAGAVRRAGIPRVTPHDLRHTAASLAISSGANAKAVQRMLGHKSAAMTLDVYADLFEDDLDAVAVAMNEAAVRALSPEPTQTGAPPEKKSRRMSAAPHNLDGMTEHDPYPPETLEQARRFLGENPSIDAIRMAMEDRFKIAPAPMDDRIYDMLRDGLDPWNGPTSNRVRQPKKASGHSEKFYSSDDGPDNP